MNNEITVACLCPPDGLRHPAGEVVTFREKLDFRTAAIARKSIAWLQQEDPSVEVPEVLAMLEEFYLLHCIGSWTLRDQKGKAIEVSKAAVREYVLPRTEVAYRLADFANDLYDEVLLGPLVATASGSSRATPTNGSTSPPKPTGRSRKPSRPSSTENIQTAATATM